ncbi:hypothetical protein CA11_33180 [Gimesia maris]|uniref:helix-turn-helix domain-containing protein n=1 Tax=Gimesia maris TaxID=122 RepID=UPI00118CEF7F|nr:helix-turn-helix domain-containing protein [Gimesia maris]QDU15493.1 hypothetical protein CA11_33180 [Gimesia maris]
MKIVIDKNDLLPLVESIVEQVFSRMESRDIFKGRLAVDETEAARLIGLKKHTLRDERLRGSITASQIVGNRIRYTASDLIDYLASRRFQVSD